MDASIGSLLWPAVNLGVLVGFLGYKLKKPTRDFVANRHIYVRDEVRRVEEMLRGAQDKYDEFSSKLGALDAEVSAIREQAKQDAEAARVRIINDGKRLSATIVTDAQASSQAMFNDLRNQLRRELGGRILDRAEQLVTERLTTADRARIRRAFSREVEQMQ